MTIGDLSAAATQRVVVPRERGRSTLLRRFLRQRAALVAAVYLALLVFVAVFAPLVAPHDPLEQNLTLINHPPMAGHLLGTDDLGRDILSRMIYGARVSLIAGVTSVMLSLLVALPVGLISGYFGGRFDTVIMRITDAIQTVPALVLALTMTAILGPGLRNVTIALAIVFVPPFLRLVRGQVLAVREETFIEASLAIGSSSRSIITRRVLHNIAQPLIVQAAITMGFALLAEAALSYLGLGVRPPTPSWGSMLSSFYQYAYTAAWQIFIPGIAIAGTVLALNLLADGLRDSLGREIRKG